MPLACSASARSSPQLPVASRQACPGRAGSGRCLASHRRPSRRSGPTGSGLPYRLKGPGAAGSPLRGWRRRPGDHARRPSIAERSIRCRRHAGRRPARGARRRSWPSDTSLKPRQPATSRLPLAILAIRLSGRAGALDPVQPGRRSLQKGSISATGTRLEGRTGSSLTRDVGTADTGQAPIIRRTARRLSQSMISAASNRGLLRFMLYQGALSADRFIAFLRRLSKDTAQKVVPDRRQPQGAPCCQGQEVGRGPRPRDRALLPAGLRARPQSRRILEQRPQAAAAWQPQPGSKDELLRGTRSVLRAIQRSPDRIRSHFRPQPVRYVRLNVGYIIGILVVSVASVSSTSSSWRCCNIAGDVRQPR